MKIRYFKDTDTMLIEFKDAPVAQTRALDENTILDLDANGNIWSRCCAKPGFFLLYNKPNKRRR